jgi:hypothetical protein
MDRMLEMVEQIQEEGGEAVPGILHQQKVEMVVQGLL